jgi:hypothetical protein
MDICLVPRQTTARQPGGKEPIARAPFLLLCGEPRGDHSTPRLKMDHDTR